MAGGFNFFNGSRVDVNYDADAYDFCILNVAKAELEEDLNSFFWGIFSATKFIFQFSLAFISDHIHEQPEVRIKYFVQDEHKSGGAIAEVSGKVKKTSVTDGTIVMADGCKIRLFDITDLGIG